MSFTLEEVNTRLASIFEHLKDYCNCEDIPLDIGCALKHKITGYIYCFKDYNLERGRGNYYECKRGDCEFYCFVDPNQAKITKFLHFPAQYPHSKVIDFESQYPHNKVKKMNDSLLEKFQAYTIRKLLKHLKDAVLIEEFDFDGDTIYIFDPLVKHANKQLYIVTNYKEITKGSFGEEWMETTRNQFNVALIQFVVIGKRINLTKLITVVSVKIAIDMLKRRKKE